MFYHFLVKRSVSEIAILTDQNSNHLFNSSQKIPTFVELSSNEDNINSVLYSVDKQMKYYKKVQLAQINCTRDNDLCGMFPDYSGETDYYWIGRFNKDPLRLLEEPTRENIESFIDELLRPTLIFVSSDDEINEFQRNNEITPYFVFNVSSSDKEIKTIAENITQNLRHLPALFYYYENSADDAVSTLKSVIDGRTAVLNRELNESNIETFIRRRSIPFNALFSDYIRKFSEEHDIPVAIFVSPENTSNAIYNNFAEESDKIMLTTYATCSQSPWICKYTNQRIGNGYIAVINRRQSTFWVYDSIADSDLVRHWLEDIDDGMVQGYGGNKGFRSLLSSFYEWRAVGGLPLSLFGVPAAVYAIIIALFVQLFSDKLIKAYRDRINRLEKEKIMAEEAAKKKRRRIE